MKSCFTTREDQEAEAGANVCICLLSTSTRANRPSSRIVGLRLKSRDNNGELISPISRHDAVVRPKERAAAILAQVASKNHWQDGIEVRSLLVPV
jgi:hypothetical protein